jgi:hypothetical protein
MTAPPDTEINAYVILTYERATGTCLNIGISKAMAGGSWDMSMNMLGIPYYQEITVLCFRITSIVARSGNVTWLWATGKVIIPRGA